MTYCPHCGEKTWTDGKGCECGGAKDFVAIVLGAAAVGLILVAV